MLEQEIRQFLDYQRDVRRLSPHTVEAYQRDLSKLANYCQERKLTHSDALDAAHIRQLIAQQRSSGASPASIHTSTGLDATWKELWWRVTPGSLPVVAVCVRP